MLPRRWRNGLPFTRSVRWTHAATVSGLLESALAAVAMAYWYSYSVMVWVNHAGQVVDNRPGAVRTEADLHALGFAAYAIMWAHPLTWLIVYFFTEGAVRLCAAAFSGGVFGLLPLAIADAVLRKLTGAPSGDSLRAPELKPTFSSVGSAVKERILTASMPESADELRLRKSGEEESSRFTPAAGRTAGILPASCASTTSTIASKNFSAASRLGLLSTSCAAWPLVFLAATSSSTIRKAPS